MSNVEYYLSRMTPENLWPADHSVEEVGSKLNETQAPGAAVLRWESNGQCPMPDMLAAWLTLGIISREQAAATEAARKAETAAFLGEYRKNPPQPDAEQLAEMRAAFGPGAGVVNVLTGQRWTA